jgi:hypothetical protein
MTCNTLNGCGLDISVTPTGELTMDAVIAALPCQALSCIPGQGLFSPKHEAEVQAGLMPANGIGWNAGVPIDLHDLPVGLGLLVAFSGDFGVDDVIPNESDCLAANLISVVTGREVRYDGPAGAHFRVTTVSKINGFGFFPLFSMTTDLRFFPAAGLITDSRPQGYSAGARVVPPGGQFTYQYQTYLTNLAAVPAGSLVGSPGVTWGHFMTTN